MFSSSFSSSGIATSLIQSKALSLYPKSTPQKVFKEVQVGDHDSLPQFNYHIQNKLNVQSEIKGSNSDVFVKGKQEKVDFSSYVLYKQKEKQVKSRMLQTSEGMRKKQIKLFGCTTIRNYSKKEQEMEKYLSRSEKSLEHFKIKRKLITSIPVSQAEEMKPNALINNFGSAIFSDVTTIDTTETEKKQTILRKESITNYHSLLEKRDKNNTVPFQQSNMKVSNSLPTFKDIGLINTIPSPKDSRKSKAKLINMFNASNQYNQRYQTTPNNGYIENSLIPFSQQEHESSNVKEVGNYPREKKSNWGNYLQDLQQKIEAKQEKHQFTKLKSQLPEGEDKKLLSPNGSYQFISYKSLKKKPEDFRKSGEETKSPLTDIDKKFLEFEKIQDKQEQRITLRIDSFKIFEGLERASTKRGGSSQTSNRIKLLEEDKQKFPKYEMRQITTGTDVNSKRRRNSQQEMEEKQHKLLQMIKNNVHNNSSIQTTSSLTAYSELKLHLNTSKKYLEQKTEEGSGSLTSVESPYQPQIPSLFSEKKIQSNLINKLLIHIPSQQGSFSPMSTKRPQEGDAFSPYSKRASTKLNQRKGSMAFNLTPCTPKNVKESNQNSPQSDKLEPLLLIAEQQDDNSFSQQSNIATLSPTKLQIKNNYRKMAAMSPKKSVFLSGGQTPAKVQRKSTLYLKRFDDIENFSDHINMPTEEEIRCLDQVNFLIPELIKSLSKISCVDLTQDIQNFCTDDMEQFSFWLSQFSQFICSGVYERFMSAFKLCPVISESLLAHLLSELISLCKIYLMILQTLFFSIEINQEAVQIFNKVFRLNQKLIMAKTLEEKLGGEVLRRRIIGEVIDFQVQFSQNAIYETKKREELIQINLKMLNVILKPEEYLIEDNEGGDENSFGMADIFESKKAYLTVLRRYDKYYDEQFCFAFIEQIERSRDKFERSMQLYRLYSDTKFMEELNIYLNHQQQLFKLLPADKELLLTTLINYIFSTKVTSAQAAQVISDLCLEEGIMAEMEKAILSHLRLEQEYIENVEYSLLFKYKFQKLHWKMNNSNPIISLGNLDSFFNQLAIEIEKQTKMTGILEHCDFHSSDNFYQLIRLYFSDYDTFNVKDPLFSITFPTDDEAQTLDFWLKCFNSIAPYATEVYNLISDMLRSKFLMELQKAKKQKQ